MRQAVLEDLGVSAGRKAGVSILPDGRVEPVAAGAALGIAAFRGIFRRGEQAPATLARMREAMERGPDR